MQLELNTFNIKNIIFSEKTEFQDGILFINEKDIKKLMPENDSIKKVELYLAGPGEEKRIVNILDVIEPRWKASGRGNVFPGVLDQPIASGTGATHRLSGALVTVTGNIPQARDPILRVHEAMIDMGGPCAKLSPFSAMYHLVVQIEVNEDTEVQETDVAVRSLGVKIASFLASTTAGKRPDKVELFPFENGSSKELSGLPKIVIVLQLASIGPLFDTFLYGRTVDGMMPTLISPNEMMDGAIVSGDYFYGGQRNPTYYYQNNPLVRELFNRNGKDMFFKGVILTRGYYNTLADKRRAASYCAKLAKLIDADGAIITIEEGGNSHTDAMLTCQECEQLGVKTVIIAGEMADVGSEDISLIDFVPEANAMISAGNREELIEIPKVKEVVGGAIMLGSNTPAAECQKVPLHYFLCSISQVGAWNITMKAY